MALRRYSDLDVLRAHIWEALTQATVRRDHGFRTMALVTAEPDVRTVVLREVDASARTLLCHTDARSAKLEQLEADPRVVWHGWDARHHEQLRLYARASIHRDDALADRIWRQASPRSLQLYLRQPAPGTVVETPTSALATEAHPSRADVEPARQHFAVVATELTRIQFLCLHPEGHYRARFEWSEHEGWAGAWIVP